jgi:hypothetical protein
LGPSFEELGLSASIHSAKNATVPTSRASSGRGTDPIYAFFGSDRPGHECFGLLFGGALHHAQTELA